MAMVKVASWGRLANAEHKLVALSGREHTPALIQQTRPAIAIGNGRSYGDQCLNPDGTLWDARFLDHFVSFDAASGRLVCEPGVLLRDIHALVVNQGWILPVTPGTQLITVAGAIANDVHGKNHHVEGTFGEHVLAITLARTDGQVLELSRTREPGLFSASIGGMGLTGVITLVELQLKPLTTANLETENVPFPDLQTFFSLADASEADWEHTVAWIDCSTRQRGRGIFQRARPAADAHLAMPVSKQWRVPLVPPLSCINRVTMGPLCAAYYALQAKKRGHSQQHFADFLYPLDNILDWNRLYGPKGFYQYQCVVPREDGENTVQEVLHTLSRHQAGSFLSVLKTFAEREAAGMLSFPAAGVTLAMDFPNRGKRTLAMLDALDSIVSRVGGRLYAAKDARMPAAFFRDSYPHVDAFLEYRDPGISSAMSRRLFGH